MVKVQSTSKLLLRNMDSNLALESHNEGVTNFIKNEMGPTLGLPRGKKKHVLNQWRLSKHQ